MRIPVAESQIGYWLPRKHWNTNEVLVASFVSENEGYAEGVLTYNKNHFQGYKKGTFEQFKKEFPYPCRSFNYLRSNLPVRR